MRKTIAITMIVLGLIGIPGIFFAKSGVASLDQGLWTFISRISPIFFLVIGLIIYYVDKKSNRK